MAKEFAIRFYKSKAWKKCREGYIQSVYGLCERCNKEGKIVNGYIVHHKIKLTPSNINDVEVSLNWNELEYVCIDCHNKEHMGNHDIVVREGLMFNEMGEMIQDETI